MNKCFSNITVCLFALLALASCHDSDGFEALLGDKWSVSVDDESLVIDRYRRYDNFTVTQNGEQDTTLTVTSDADWLTLTVDTLPKDGIVDFLVEENDEVKSRTANITLSSTDNPEHTATISVRQKGMGDYDDNDNSDKNADYAVGWGFNAYEEFKNSVSVKSKIIDDALLQKFDSDTTFKSIQESVRGRASFDVYTAYSMQEMSNTLTKTTEETSKYLFYKKTMKRYEKICKTNTNEQLYGYARMTKIVASRSIDQGALEYILNDENVIKNNSQPFTKEFREIFDRIVNSSGTQQDSLIKVMLNKFGTHIVIDASVGGAIDYMVTFSRSVASSFEKTCEEQCSHVFGRSSSSNDEKISNSTTSTINNGNAIQILGGSEATRSSLVNTIKGMTQADQLDSKKLSDWETSISATCLDDAASRKNLDIVDFRFIPIWKVFPTVDLQNLVASSVIAMGENSNTSFSDNDLGVDNYSIDLTRDDFSSFGTANESTLVKVVYYGNVPIVEICNEYVPQIRGDRRITVFYPIYKGQTRIGQGLFPGDGEGNPPAYLTFSGGDVYVNPIDGYGYNDTIAKAYYLHGNLYDQDYGTALKKTKKITVSEQYLQFTKKYPIVKIGSGYWTRSNIMESMMFGEPVDASDKYTEYYIYEDLRSEDGMLFANFFDGNQYDFKEDFPIYGTDENQWYLPTISDSEYLTMFLGSNLKAMLKGQISGFDAQYAGCYVRYDIMNRNKDMGYYQYLYDGEYCFIPFKNNSKKGAVLVLDKNYRLETIDVDYTREGFYPIRLFRTSKYEYTNIK